VQRSSKAGRILIGILLLLALGVFVTKTWFINVYRVPQNGMYPTIQAGGLVFARVHPYKSISAVNRGDIIVAKQVDEGENLVQVWRVIGLPGDEVKVLNDAVTLNQAPLPREEVRQEGKVTIYRERILKAFYEVAVEVNPSGSLIEKPVTVPANQLYVLGDNRSKALDSRQLGPVRFESIVGKKL
jgi:signal peptidase I